MSLRSHLLSLSIPLQKLFQKLGKPEPRVKYVQVREALYLAKPGDCILTREDYRLTNLFIPGFWSHAAILNDELMITEATSAGVTCVHPVEMLLKKDDFIILRPQFLDIVDAIQAGKYARSQIGLPYDYLFSTNKAWYCSELVYFSYQYAHSTTLPIEPTKVFGELSITPDHFINQHMKEIYRS